MKKGRRKRKGSEVNLNLKVILLLKLCSHLSDKFCLVLPFYKEMSR